MADAKQLDDSARATRRWATCAASDRRAQGRHGVRRRPRPDAHDASFLRLIVELATVGLTVVAEGIETGPTRLLGALGCDLAQGYYFAAPMDVDADWLAPGTDLALHASAPA